MKPTQKTIQISYLLDNSLSVTALAYNEQLLSSFVIDRCKS